MMFPGIPDQDQKRRILERVELEEDQGMKVTEEMVDRALAVRVDLIQGFHYPKRDLPHVIRDFRTKSGGADVWAGSSHSAMMKMLTQMKMSAQITAAMSPAYRETP